MNEHELPFKVGQPAEARSFVAGYRGAWFRCKIVDIRQKTYGIECALQYYDFPDEKVRWTKLYQKPRKSKTKMQLILRPCFPPVCRESQLPDIKTISEAVVIVNDVWKVGDLVDWWTDDCYWTGRITEVLGNDKFQVELLPPPVGEGLSYEAFCKDFRPSLDWSPEHGWTVPIPVGKENPHCCARLMQPINQVAGASENLTARAIDEGRTDLQARPGASLEYNASFSSDISASSLPPLHISEQTAKRPLSTTASKETQMPEINLDLDATDAGIVKTSCSDSVSSSHIRGASAKEAGNACGKDSHENNGSSKKTRTDGSICLNSTCCDTIEAAILDLEELVNRVKWIKRILEVGLPLSNSVQPSWKFLEHRASSMPK